MKRFLSLLLIVFLLCGCSDKSDLPDNELTTFSTDPPAEEATEEPAGFSIYGTDRAIAVMIDNDGTDSRPQAGLEDAYLIYEMYVEGRATRLMAVFKGADTPKIGPVRSSRHYFLEYALDCGALYAHAGWSPRAMEDISSLSIDNLNGLVYEPTYYWRERKYKGDYHSLYTSTENLRTLAEKLRCETDSEVLPFKYSEDGKEYEGTPALEADFPYASFYDVSYKYDSETGLYERFINSQYHSTQSGTKLTAKQIIVQIAENYNLGDGTARQELETTGSGSGYLITGGISVPLTWKRASRTSKLAFYTEDGKEIELSSAGATFVQVVPSSLQYKID